MESLLGFLQNGDELLSAGGVVGEDFLEFSQFNSREWSGNISNYDMPFLFYDTDCCVKWYLKMQNKKCHNQKIILPREDIL
jgi:hypothetical protein